MYDVQSANGTDSVVENTVSCQRDPHVCCQLTHNRYYVINISKIFESSGKCTLQRSVVRKLNPPQAGSAYKIRVTIMEQRSMQQLKLTDDATV